jgi:hypothetical protein
VKGSLAGPLALVVSAAVFTSAALLFSLQPMVARMLLPLFGGAPAVWNTCLVFYQAVLLLGYAWSHVVASRLGLRRQVLLHGALLLVALAGSPVRIPREAPGPGDPVLELLFRLTTVVGLPFFALSATGPLLQSWFAASRHRAALDPYFLYAASNTGSLAALIAYPTLVEPHLRLVEQSRLFVAGLLLLTLLSLLAGALVLRFRDPARAGPGEAAGSVPAAARLAWALWSFLPCSLMMGVTLHLTTDIAPIAFLWIVPLALYLVAFVVAFARPPRWVARGAAWLALPLAVAVAYFRFSGIYHPVWLAVTLPLLTLFVVGLACLGLLAEARPGREHLTEYYLWISAGGVLAGVFNSLVAPLVFETVAEYPLVLIVTAGLLVHVLRPGEARLAPAAALVDVLLGAGVGLATAWLVSSWPLSELDLTAVGALVGFPRWRITTVLTYLVPALACLLLALFRRSLAFALGLAAFCFVSARFDESGRLVYRQRSFYGVLSVQDDAEGECRYLVNGSTLHGRQFLDPERRTVPLAFYHRQGPVGDIFDEFSGERRKSEVGVVGLGAGSMAAYGEPGQRMTFYEIDPHVVEVSRGRRLFSYLADSKAQVEVVLGDARLRLAEAPSGRYGLLFVDAFSSDAIPMHLLTREALDLYLDKLSPDGVLAMHVTNRYLDLAPFVGRLAEERGLTARFQSWPSRDGCGRYVTDWVVLARTEGDLGGLLNAKFWTPLQVPAGTPLWTDDFSNLLAALHWGGSTR